MQEERFDVKENRDPYDLDIYDRQDQQGIHVLGKVDAVDRFYSLLGSRLPDVVLWRWKVAVNGIYKGLIKGVNYEQGFALVDIGHATGWLKIREDQKFESEEIIAQVQRRSLGARRPILSVDITISGKYTVLTTKRQTKISRKIRDQDSRDRLHQLGENLDLNGGIIWRTKAADQPNDVLRHEVAKLIEKRRAIREIADKSEEAPTLIWGETYFMDVEFPAHSKKKLDEIRSTVTPTIKDHHFYKTCGGRVSSAVDMAERLLRRGGNPLEVEESFKSVVETEFPIENSKIEIEHVKLDGRIFHLGIAEIQTFNQDSFKYRRWLKKGGVYNGLGTPKEEDDHAETETKIGGWYLKTKYFSKNGQFKGMYVNLNTPVELYPRKLRYVDLEVDISIRPDGETKVLDEEKLKEMVREGYITQNLAEKVRKKLKNLLKEIKDEFIARKQV
jgi:hypothetical protein